MEEAEIKRPKKKYNQRNSFDRSIGKVGFGWCVWNHQGRFLIAKTSLVAGFLDVTEGEALGLL